MARQSIGTSGDEEAQFGSQTEKESLSRKRSINKKDWGGCKRRHSWLQVSKRQRHGFSSPGTREVACTTVYVRPGHPCHLQTWQAWRNSLCQPLLFVAVIYKKGISVNHLFVSSVYLCMCAQTHTHPQIIAFMWNSEVSYKSQLFPSTTWVLAIKVWSASLGPRAIT